MRQHLHDCIDKEDLFPAKRRRCQKTTIGKKMQAIEVYCHCRLAAKKGEKMVSKFPI